MSISQSSFDEIVMSADDSRDVVMTGVVHGACDYLIEPVRMEPLNNVWQHVVRKKKSESGSYDDGGNSSSSMNNGNGKGLKRKIGVEEAEDREDNGSGKKPRVVWSVELHQQFVAAVNRLGIDKAVPKKILDLMNVPWLTRENVASHLQKYRLYLRRLSSLLPHQAIPSFRPMSPLDIKTLAVAGQLRGPNLSSYQPGLSRSTIPFVDQRNAFSLETHKIRFVEGQHMQQLNNNNNNNNMMTTLSGIADSSPKYDAFSQTIRQNVQDWQGSSLSYGVTQNRPSKVNNINLTSSVMLNNCGFSGSQKAGLNGNSFVGNASTMVSAGVEVVQQGSGSRIVNSNNISKRVKSEKDQELNSGKNPYACHFADDGLMSAFLNQQEGNGSVEGEFEFDGYTLGNIPV